MKFVNRLVVNEANILHWLAHLCANHMQWIINLLFLKINRYQSIYCLWKITDTGIEILAENRKIKHLRLKQGVFTLKIVIRSRKQAFFDITDITHFLQFYFICHVDLHMFFYWPVCYGSWSRLCPYPFTCIAFQAQAGRIRMFHSGVTWRIEPWVFSGII